MKLYFHADRANGLKPGDIVRKEPYRGESIVPALMPFAVADFLNSLDEICKDGLSMHGAQYLIKVAHSPLIARDFLLELQFEYIRSVYYKNRPSRFQSMFAFSEYARALQFMRDTGDGGKIYEIDFSGGCFVGDMKWLSPDMNPDVQKQNARSYWEGKPYSYADSYEPDWECVIDLPVKILREITKRQ